MTAERLHSSSSEAITVATADFTLKLLHCVIQTNQARSTVISPLCIWNSLAIVAEGAEGRTREQLIDVIAAARSLNEIRLKSASILAKLASSTNFRFISHGFLRSTVHVLPSFDNVLTESYASKFYPAEYDDVAKLVADINNFVKQRTCGKIARIVSPEHIDATSILLVNALHFEAKWLKPFKPVKTRMKPFYSTPTDAADVRTMFEQNEWPFFTDSEFEILSMPYEDEDIRFTIFLPREKCSLFGKLHHLTGAKLLEYVAKCQTTEVMAFVPKFRICEEHNFSQHLSSLGIVDAFSAGAADLSNLTDSKEPLMIGGVVQKALIDVTEEGTVAAAATGMWLTTAPPIEIPIFDADHPFLFMVSSSDGDILFIGTYCG